MNRFLIILCCSLLTFNVFSQERCASAKIYQALLSSDSIALQRSIQFENLVKESIPANDLNPKIHPELGSRSAESITVIPVVVHIVYNTSLQNVSDAAVIDQLYVMNTDYRMRNADTLHIDHPFWSFTADPKVEFCLATVDPFGNPTTGITRTSTTTTRFDADTINNWSDVKYTATGGIDNWDPTKYLNIWVCNLTGNALAISTFPSELAVNPDEDGITISYKYFGVGGSTIAPYNLGRSMTHEIGHWLGLKHIWGDAYCGNDAISDTKVAESENYGCPSFPRRPMNSCGGDGNGEMYMNFMDYVYDDCMNMFTFGQVTRMQSTLSTIRATIPIANRCLSRVNIHEIDELKFNIYPSPASQSISIDLGQQQINPIKINILNSLGQKLKGINNDGLTQIVNVDVSDLSNGSYFIEINDGKLRGLHRFIILR